MRLITAFIIMYILILSPVLYAEIWDRKKPVTPYGDFCPRCSKYGICKYELGNKEIQKGLKDYYGKKGLDVKINNMKGRFIKATVKDNDRVVDVIIFDRHTGRIRSIF